MTEKKGPEMRITHLKYREIQASIVSSLIHGFVREVGYEKTIEVVRKVINEDAIQSGKKLAEEWGEDTIAALAKIVKEVWAKDGAMEIEIIRENDNELSFDVMRTAPDLSLPNPAEIPRHPSLAGPDLRHTPVPKLIPG